MPLKSWLARGRVSLEEGLRLAARLASIVGDVHAAQIIHKDINPHNIVYNPQTGVAKLIDFDIATQLRSEGARFSAAAGLEGTLAYIAPEQTGRMNRALDYRADLYSLGITIYELLTGVLPHDSGDPLEIVHFHIAGALTPPHVCDPQVPRVVSDIVAKLLAKAPEDRYQSAIGAAHDLAVCHEQLRTSGRIDTFPIAAHDAVDRFEPPQKLYGRSTNVDALLASFERVAKGCVEAVLVSGHAGVGKTALVQEIYEPVTRRRGYFAAGKFDQLRRDIPFSGLVNALQDLVQQLLTEDEGALADWRRAIQAAVAPNGRLLLDVLPALELIIGPQPSVPPLDAVAAQNRFNLVFKSFMKLFCTKQNADDPHAPLVLFLDDMQWADPASLNLVTMLLSATTTESLLLIGACRDEETNATHPLTLALEEQRERGVRIETVSLAPLAIGEVAQLVADATREEPEGARPLAETILRKTGGNPFFVRQFLQTLHTEKLIAWDGAARRFRYSIADIEAASITENVAELLARKLDRLPGFTRLALSLAAAIGNDFELNALAIVCERSAVDVAAALEHAVRDGLIAPTSKLASLDPERLDAPLVYHRYVFLHDRIQQAAYATIPAEGRAGLHLAIGRILLLGTADADLDARIFDIVHHLNHGIAVIDEPGERLRLATLNLRAGTRAKNSTAYALGVQAFRVGIELLGAGAWSGRYETAYELHSKLAECLCLTGDYPAALAVLDDAAAHARAGADLSKLHAQKVIVCVIRGDMRAALECAWPGRRGGRHPPVRRRRRRTGAARRRNRRDSAQDGGDGHRALPRATVDDRRGSRGGAHDGRAVHARGGAARPHPVSAHLLPRRHALARARQLRGVGEGLRELRADPGPTRTLRGRLALRQAGRRPQRSARRRVDALVGVLLLCRAGVGLEPAGRGEHRALPPGHQARTAVRRPRARRLQRRALHHASPVRGPAARRAGGADAGIRAAAPPRRRPPESRRPPSAHAARPLSARRERRSAHAERRGLR
jgi:hypothetical protein